MRNCFKALDSLLEAKEWSTLRFLSVLFGGILIQLVFGTVYTFGNLNPYMTSYMRYKGIAPTLTYTECSWFYVACIMGQGTFMSTAGFLENKLGMRWASLLGCSISCLGVALTYFSIQYSFGAVVFTQGVMFGMGAGIGYTLPLTCGMKWLKDKPGMASGVINGGIGGGALIFNMVQTSFINPENKRVRLEVDGEKYFDQPDVIERVPYVFLMLSGVYALMQLVGCLLLTNPPLEKRSEISHTKGQLNGGEEQENVTIPLLLEQERNHDKMVASLQEHKDKAAVAGEDGSDMSPREVLKTKDFYLMFFIFFFNGLGVAFLNVLYKAFGLTFINDDVFLSLVGTASSVFNSLGRIVWGIVADKVSFRVTTMCIATLFSATMITFQVTQYTTRYLFMVYVCLLLFFGTGTFTLIPTAAAKRFGKTHVTTIYGMLYVSQILIVPLTFGLFQAMLTYIGWTGILFFIAGLSYIAFILAFIFNGKDKNGKDV